MKMVVRKDRACRDVFRELEDCSARDSISVLSRVTDDELRLLYRQCAGLVMPSLKEGFGLPALEAMAAGSSYLVIGRPITQADKPMSVLLTIESEIAF